LLDSTSTYGYNGGNQALHLKGQRLRLERCAVNPVSGTLLLSNNTHGVEAIGNTVGALGATGNSGPGPTRAT
jgi:hypothetical protein